MGTVGRPAQFRNAAEKQKAYRERKKANESLNEFALALLNDLNQQEVTLRNHWTSLVGKAKKVEVEYDSN